MKTIVLAVSLVAALLSDERKAKLRTYQGSCIDESAVDPTVLEDAKHGKFDDDIEGESLHPSQTIHEYREV
ncbi:ObirObpFrag1 [Ooceraea biroi]|uniref:ObirObpFrag1 n=1 Tax=Ooceraea biroi TaxID=2015173 RepID=A0A3L8D681_OOCBI|nr:ObirObpFrag1 [Ooceraea biroi]